MGRHQEYKNKKGIMIYLEGEELSALEDIRWRERMDITEVGRKAILEYIKAHAAGNETFRLDDWVTNPEFKAIPTLWANLNQWSQYAKDCKVPERAKLLKKINDVRKTTIQSGPLK
jgi:hypothetical protein